jgi:hypothetical protein
MNKALAGDIMAKALIGIINQNLVPGMGLEPIWISPFDFKSNAYTNSATRAYGLFYHNFASFVMFYQA